MHYRHSSSFFNQTTQSLQDGTVSILSPFTTAEFNIQASNWSRNTDINPSPSSDGSTFISPPASSAFIPPPSTASSTSSPGPRDSASSVRSSVSQHFSPVSPASPGSPGSYPSELSPSTSNPQPTSDDKQTKKHFIDVFNQRPFRLTVKVLVPTQENPKFNFVGKLLGPKGKSLKRLQDKTQTRMAVFGKGSMKSRQQEIKLLHTGDKKYKHLEDDLHVEISTYGSPVEVYSRISSALLEIRPYLVPDKNDDIRQLQRQELGKVAKKRKLSSCASDQDPITNAANVS